MNWSLRQIANETGLSIYTIRKNYTKNKLELATHVSKGSLRQILLTDLGKKKLLVQCRCSAGVDIAQSNSTKNISEYAVTIDEIEARTGIDFFNALPDSIENNLEDTLIQWDYVKIRIVKTSTSDSTSNSVQCKGYAKSTGKRCKNKTSNANGYCNRHQSQANSDAKEDEE